MNFLRYWDDWILDIRFSIFIITGVCAGLPALVWSVSDIINLRKNGQRISIFIILLLLTDFLELYLSPYILIKVFLKEIPLYSDRTYWNFKALWWAMKHCGFLLNQSVALEGILSVKYSTSAFCLPCFEFIQILIFLCVIISHFVFPFEVHRMDFPLVVLIVSTASVIPLIMNICSASCHTQTSRKSDNHIAVILIFTLVVLYLPCALIFIKYLQRLIVCHIYFLLLSLRLIADPLLCVLVCRQNLSLQTSRKPEESSLV